MDTQHSQRDDRQSELERVLSTYVPETFRLANLISLDPGWQINIADENGVVVGTGASIEEAFAAAEAKAARHEYVGRFSLAAMTTPAQEKITGLFAKLGFKKAAGPQVTRRL